MTNYESKNQEGGSRVYIYKLDPSVKFVGHRGMWVESNITSEPGLSTKDIVILKKDGQPWPVKPTDPISNNFHYDPKSNPSEFDAVHVLAVVDFTLNMYRRGIERYWWRSRDNQNLLNRANARPLFWQWGAEPIRVTPHAGDAANALYNRKGCELKFFYFTAEDGKEKGKKIYTARSFQVVAHETGHAILDALKPKFMDTTNPQTGAFHESFADITATLGLLEQLDMCEAIIADSKSNLEDRNIMTNLADQFGEALGHPFGLRCALNNKKLDEVTEEVHDLSQVFTGAFYDILVAF